MLQGESWRVGVRQRGVGEAADDQVSAAGSGHGSTHTRSLAAVCYRMRVPLARFLWLALALAACAAGGETVSSEPRVIPFRGSPIGVAAVPAPVAAEPARAVERGGPEARSGLSPSAARRYMVELINRDRASMGVGPVSLDEGAPTRAGQAHADDMAKHGYLGHWGTDGSVPEQRFTEAGGVDMVLENASCFIDEKIRSLDRAPKIDPEAVEQTED